MDEWEMVVEWTDGATIYGQRSGTGRVVKLWWRDTSNADGTIHSYNCDDLTEIALWWLKRPENAKDALQFAAEVLWSADDDSEVDE